VLSEYEAFRRWRALRGTVKSQRQLARALGVSQATISFLIRSHGKYKKASPE
jgi:hypothetical protein